MRIRRIYLDLDDVCNTLSMHFLHLVGCKISSTEYAEYPVTGPVDLAEVANQLLGGEYSRGLPSGPGSTARIGPSVPDRRSSLGYWNSAKDWSAARTS